MAAADERQRISAIAHAGSPMWAPVSEETILAIVDRVADLGLGPRHRVLDLGCGPAELLRRVTERTGASGLGIDASPAAIEEARRRIGEGFPTDRLRLQLGDVHGLPRRPEYDLVMCIGPGWQVDGWRSLTTWAAGFALPGAHLLLGEVTWRSLPDPAALERLGMRADAYVSTPDVHRSVRAADSEPLWSHTSTSDEWDEYATAYRAAMIRFVEEHPDDPVTPAVHQRAGPGWAEYELLHSVLDFVTVLIVQPP